VKKTVTRKNLTKDIQLAISFRNVFQIFVIDHRLDVN